jgi:hypothetical protein
LKQILILVIIGFSLQSCNNKSSQVYSFYFWKSNFQLASSELTALNKVSDSTLYLRYFDVEWNKQTNKAIPISPIHFKTKLPVFLNVTPVVYIKNEVFEKIKTDSIPHLAKQIHQLITDINAVTTAQVKTIQFDCDWTLTTKSNFFSFLNQFQSISTTSLECTIRLHQIKYFETTGVPSVNSGVLMYYNMSALNVGEINSIYDRHQALLYLSRLKEYPLPLKYALPIFSWAVLHDGKKVKGLLNKTTYDMLANDTNLVLIDENNFKITSSYFRNGQYLKAGDFLKLESITPSQLQEMKGDLKMYAKQTPTNYIYFDLDSLNLLHHENF